MCAGGACVRLQIHKHPHTHLTAHTQTHKYTQLNTHRQNRVQLKINMEKSRRKMQQTTITTKKDYQGQKQNIELREIL